MVTEGIEFVNAKADVVIDYLKSRELLKKEVNPSSLRIENEGKLLILQLMNGRMKEYPIRKAFLYKLLRWYKFPINQLFKLSLDTISSICNDYLMNIKRNKVILKIENQEALSILSPDYNEITDIEVINEVTKLGVRNISRNDFFLSIKTEDKIKIQPVKGDDFGIGINITNSETGFRSLKVSHFLLRYICSNGAYSKISAEEDNFKHHYGKVNLKKFLNTHIKKAEESRKQLIEKLIESNNIILNTSKEFYIKKLEPILGKKEATSLFSDFSQYQTLYELFNSITLKAKNYDLSKRYFLEGFAGDMLLNFSQSNN